MRFKKRLQIRALKTSQCVDNCYLFTELIIVIFLTLPNFPCSRQSLYNSAMEISCKLRSLAFGKDQPRDCESRGIKARVIFQLLFTVSLFYSVTGECLVSHDFILNTTLSKNESVKMSPFEALARFHERSIFTEKSN